MATPIKDFAALSKLRAQMKQQDEARVAAAAQQQREQQNAQQAAQLFARSVGAVVPLPADSHAAPRSVRPMPTVRQPAVEQITERAALLQASLSDGFIPEALQTSVDQTSFVRAGVDADILRKLQRGHWKLQAQLDLHGLRRDDARAALISFLRDSTQQHLRCVCIIHGKGLGSANQQALLKNLVPGWLAQKQEVMAFCQAAPSDGGAGALLVLLKSKRRAV